MPSSTVLRQREGRLEWSCGACGTINSVEHLRCPTCGAALIAPARGRSVADWRTALLWSALVPGAGHVVAGRIGAGIARLVLFVVWLAGGLALALDGGRAVLAATPLLLGVLILWTTSVLDVLALSRGRQELLDGRVMLWLVVGVIALSLVGVAAGVAAR